MRLLNNQLRQLGGLGKGAISPSRPKQAGRGSEMLVTLFSFQYNVHTEQYVSEEPTLSQMEHNHVTSTRV